LSSPTLRDFEDFSDFILFAAIVEQGGLAGASRSLGIPKSRLSRRLADLEDRYAVQLVHRTSRRFNVTELGQSFYERCKQMVERSQAAKDFIAQAQARPKGLLRVSAPAALANHWLAPRLPIFLFRYPEITLEIDARNWVNDLVVDRIDVAIRIRRMPLDDSDLIVRHLGVSRNILVAAPSFMAAEEIHAPEDLQRIPLLSVPASEGPSIWPLRRSDDSVHTLTVTPKLVTNELSVLRAAAEAGVGVAMLPAHYCKEHLDCGALVTVLPDWAGPINDIHAAYLSRKGLSVVARAFLDFLVDELPRGDQL
jgi:DNA-binding transcriptional LysR family regulator